MVHGGVCTHEHLPDAVLFALRSAGSFVIASRTVLARVSPMASVASFRRGQAVCSAIPAFRLVAATACGVLAPALHLRAHATGRKRGA
jgi:hypothetical protein